MKKSVFVISLLTVGFCSVFCSCKTEVMVGFDPNRVDAHTITYVTDKGETPKIKAITHGASISSKFLPAITTDYYSLDGWYIGEEKITAGYIVERDIVLTAKWNLTGYEFNWADSSKTKINCDARSDLTNDGYYLKGTQTKSKGSSLNNWVINNNGAQLNGIQGFEAKVKIQGSCNDAGIQLYGKSSWDYYGFFIYADGRFRVFESDYVDSNTTKTRNIVNKKDPNFKIDLDDFNTIKVVTTPMLDTEVYINGYKACTILKDDLIITKDSLTFAHQTTSSTSESNPAYAWLHFLSYQTVK